MKTKKKSPAPRHPLHGLYRMFSQYYELAASQSDNVASTRRQFTIDKTQRSLNAEAFRMTKRSLDLLVDWAVSHVIEPKTQTNVFKMSGAPDIEGEEADEKKTHLKFSMGLNARLAPARAEAMAYDLVSCVLHLYKPFIEGLDEEGAKQKLRALFIEAETDYESYKSRAEAYKKLAEKAYRKQMLMQKSKPWIIGAAIGIMILVAGALSIL
ncbi:hypothetical protein ACI2KR_26950 [Pseudomonas luteola]